MIIIVRGQLANSSLYHAASQAPLLSVRLELQGLVIEMSVIVYNNISVQIISMIPFSSSV